MPTPIASSAAATAAQVATGRQLTPRCTGVAWGSRRNCAITSPARSGGASAGGGGRQRRRRRRPAARQIGSRHTPRQCGRSPFRAHEAQKLLGGRAPEQLRGGAPLTLDRAQWNALRDKLAAAAARHPHPKGPVIVRLRRTDLRNAGPVAGGGRSCYPEHTTCELLPQPPASSPGSWRYEQNAVTPGTRWVAHRFATDSITSIDGTGRFVDEVIEIAGRQASASNRYEMPFLRIAVSTKLSLVRGGLRHRPPLRSGAVEPSRRSPRLVRLFACAPCAPGRRRCPSRLFPDRDSYRGADGFQASRHRGWTHGRRTAPRRSESSPSRRSAMRLLLEPMATRWAPRQRDPSGIVMPLLTGAVQQGVRSCP